MDTKTALGAAGGITLTIAGVVSALFLTLGGGANAADEPPSPTTVEYVDQYGNPIDLEQPIAPEIVVTTEPPAATNADSVLASGSEPAPAYTEPGEAYEEDEHEEAHDEYEEEDDD